MHQSLGHVAIIGAGLGGCAAALALSQKNIPVTIYESRPRDSGLIKSGVILTPNGLWVLDQLGVFARIKDRCFTTKYRIFKNDKDETVKKTVVSDESLYGYRNHRIWRKLLLDEMKLMLAELSVHIDYDSKFNGIVSDTAEGVVFDIDDSEHAATLLIGLDGIYSQVRQYLNPGVQPEYTGVVGVLSHIKRASVAWPFENYEPNATIQGKPGAIFFLPEDPQLEDIMIGTQVQYPEQSREDLQRLENDKDKLIDFYRQGYDEHGPTARSIIDSVTENKESCFIWPFVKMPTLWRWFSDTGRVIIAGDGAHALPPSSGQGVNQALEDVYSLTLLLTSMSEQDKTVSGVNGNQQDINNKPLTDALSYWQDMRQQRIDRIFDWVMNYQNVERMPEEDRKKFNSSHSATHGDDMSWLYQPTLQKDVEQWLHTKSD